MTEKFIYLIHSKQIISYSLFSKNIKIDEQTNIIDINNGNEIMKLSNIPINDTIKLYNYRLEKELIYNNSISLRNFGYLKIIIGLNLTILEEFITTGKSIPSRTILFKLLRKNKNLENYYRDSVKFIDNYKTKYNVSNMRYRNILIDRLITTENKEYTASNILKNNIYKYNNLYIDIELERFYLETDDINTNITIKGSILNTEKNCGKRFCLLHLLKLNNLKKDTTIDKYLYSKGTIIFTTNINKWKEEIKINYKNAIYICISNKLHFEKYTYHDLINADIVLVNYNFLLNSVFRNILLLYQNNNQSIEEIIETIILEYNRKTNLEYENKALLFLIQWKRMIIDEYDLLQTYNEYPYISSILKYTNSNYKWMIGNYMNITNNNILDMSKYIIDGEINTNLLSNNLFRERVFNILFENIKTFLSKPNIREYKINIKSNITENNENNIENNIDHNVKNLQHINSCLSKLKRNYCNNNTISNYLDNSNHYLININLTKLDDCPICLNKIDENNTGVLICGHIYCYTCVNNVPKCPNCRKFVNYKDIFSINNNLTNQVLSNRYGNKFNYFITHNTNISSKIIIFSELYNTVNIITNILQFMGYNVNNNLKKTYIMDNSNIFFIYSNQDFEITNWKQIDKIILWDNTLDSSSLEAFKEKNIYKNLLGLDKKKEIHIEYYQSIP